MSRPPNLAGSLWADWANVTVELGVIDSWTASGGQWDGAKWDQGVWGEAYLTPHHWVDVTRDVMSLDLDTGRNGVDDPGDVGTCSLVLYDPIGAYAIAGNALSALGDLLRVTASGGGKSRAVFTGVIDTATAHGDLVAPATSVHALDLVGALVATDDSDPVPAQTVTARLNYLLDRAGVPAELRDLGRNDPTALLALTKAGSRLDAARGAAASSVGGSLWATGDGLIRYRYGDFMYTPQTPLAFTIGTTAGAVCPSALDLSEAAADILNVYSWTTSNQAGPLNASASDAASIKRFGRRSSIRTDLLNSDSGQLAALVQAELARTAWAPERVDNCTITVHDDPSAALVVVQVLDLVAFAYSGAAPWSSRQLVGGYAHHITPDEWTVDIRAYPAIEATQWDVAKWDQGTWSLGATPVLASV